MMTCNDDSRQHGNMMRQTLAGVAGFEPATDGFGDRCSTGLSYTPTLFSALRQNKFIIPIGPGQTLVKLSFPRNSVIDS